MFDYKGIGNGGGGDFPQALAAFDIAADIPGAVVFGSGTGTPAAAQRFSEVVGQIQAELVARGVVQRQALGFGLGFERFGFGVGVVGVDAELVGNLAAEFGFKAYRAGAAGDAESCLPENLAPASKERPFSGLAPPGMALAIDTCGRKDDE